MKNSCQSKFSSMAFLVYNAHFFTGKKFVNLLFTLLIKLIIKTISHLNEFKKLMIKTWKKMN